MRQCNPRQEIGGCVIHIVERETGSYSDYRCMPLWYFDNEDDAKAWCEKAAAARALIYEKIQNIDKKYADDTEDMMGAKSEKAINRAIKANKFDPNLERYDYSDATYRVNSVKKFKGAI